MATVNAITGRRALTMDDVIQIKPAAPDSQYRLVPCKKCGRDNVAYVQYNGKDGAAWRVTCFSCGHTVDKGNRVRHDAQMAWNGEVEA
jgi:ribosomal protein S27E